MSIANILEQLQKELNHQSDIVSIEVQYADGKTAQVFDCGNITRKTVCVKWFNPNEGFDQDADNLKSYNPCH